MTMLWLFETDTGIRSLNEISRKVRSLPRISFNERINFRKILNGFEKMASREQINSGTFSYFNSLRVRK